jgi:hypothetical protein
MARGLTLIGLKILSSGINTTYKTNPMGIRTNSMQRGFFFFSILCYQKIGKICQSLAKFLKLTLEKQKSPYFYKKKLSRKQQNLLK